MGKNYLTWILDIEIHLQAACLEEAIVVGNHSSKKSKAKVLITLRWHLHEDFRFEYLIVKDPQELWRDLKDCFEPLTVVILLKARYERMHLRLKDFQSINAYNFAMHCISSQLRLCGEPIREINKLEKSFSIFHAFNVVLQKQYREKDFQKHYDLFVCLLVTEQNNELLMRNHGLRPTGFTLVPKVHATDSILEVHAAIKKFNGPYHGRKQGRGYYNKRSKGYKKQAPKEGTSDQKSSSKSGGSECYKYGMKGRRSRTCRTPKHLVKAYQAFIRNKEKTFEANIFQEPRLGLKYVKKLLEHFLKIPHWSG